VVVVAAGAAGALVGLDVAGFEVDGAAVAVVAGADGDGAAGDVVEVDPEAP
jgi:hypothetical protein